MPGSQLLLVKWADWNYNNWREVGFGIYLGHPVWVHISHSFFFSCAFQEHPPCLVILFLLVWHILLTYGRNLTEGRGKDAHNIPCECSFYDKAVQPNDAGFLCPSCSQGFESPQQCRRFPVALGPLASCFSFGKRTIYDPEASHPGRPLLSQFWLFFIGNTFPHSHSPAILPFLVFLPNQRFLSSCGFPSMLLPVPSLPFTWSFHTQVLLSWIMLSWKLVIKI